LTFDSIHLAMQRGVCAMFHGTHIHSYFSDLRSKSELHFCCCAKKATAWRNIYFI